MKPSEVIATRDKWTQEHYARNIRGEAVPSASEDAVCWCAMGAMRKALGPNSLKKVHHFCVILADIVPDGIVGTWNDDPRTTYEEVVAKLQQAEAIYAKEHPEDPL